MIVETVDRKTRQWLDSVEKVVEEAKYDYGTDASVKYIKKTTPGQNEKKTAETKPSKYTKRFKQMFGDE